MRDKIFITIIALFLIISLSLSLVKGEEKVSLIENRKLNSYPELSLTAFINTDFQKQFETAIADQFYASANYKLLYNTSKNKLSTVSNKLLYSMVEQTVENAEFEAEYIAKGDFLFEIAESGHLIVFVYQPLLSDLISQKLAVINSIAEHNPETAFYFYYIEAMRDVDFRHKKIEHSNSQQLAEELNPAINFQYFAINKLSDFQDNFYKSDHHWNHKGQAKGYSEVINLLFDGKIKPLELEPVFVKDAYFSGSRARQIGDLAYHDDFYVNKADLPAYQTAVNHQISDYNKIEQYLAGNVNQDKALPHYAECYGYDNALITYDYQQEGENLLIIGDSFSNSINHLIASHFNKTYVVDVRHYPNVFGQPFKAGEFIKQQQIDKVLFLLSKGMIINDEFVLEE